MRIVVTGASGNVGTGLLRRLGVRMPDAEIIGVCRRPPRDRPPYQAARWESLDLAAPTAIERARALFAGADAVVHLAWALQPVRHEQVMYRVNIGGTRAVLDAVAWARVPHLVFTSSLAAYSPDRPGPVDEDAATGGHPSSAYSRHKVAAERMLDAFQAAHPGIRVARVRPTLVGQRAAAAHLGALYFGPLRPLVSRLLRIGRPPWLPLPSGLDVQLVHADDVADALVTILRLGVEDSFNLAADRLSGGQLAGALGARELSVAPAAMRAVVGTMFRARLHDFSAGWYDLATGSPVMSTDRARTELDWRPARSSEQVLAELLEAWAADVPGISPALGERAAG